MTASLNNRNPRTPDCGCKMIPQDVRWMKQRGSTSTALSLSERLAEKAGSFQEMFASRGICRPAPRDKRAPPGTPCCRCSMPRSCLRLAVFPLGFHVEFLGKPVGKSATGNHTTARHLATHSEKEHCSHITVNSGS